MREDHRAVEAAVAHASLGRGIVDGPTRNDRAGLSGQSEESCARPALWRVWPSDWSVQKTSPEAEVVAGAVTGLEAGERFAAARHGGATMNDQRADIYSRITNQIIAAIAAGTGEFRMPWHHECSATTRPVNVMSGKRYRGANVLALWTAAKQAGYDSGVWGTYRQWAAKEGQVRRGERATAIMFWKPVERHGDGPADVPIDTDADGRKRFFARSFSVFNRDQVDGYAEPAQPVLPESERVSNAEAFFAALGIPITYGAGSAFYRIQEDRIHMPNFSAFVDPHAFYSTLYHEAGHASGARHRLDRQFNTQLSKHAVAIEELVAELTAAFVLADLGLASRPREDHAAYVASWLRALKEEKRAVITAASKAQQAADWMHEQQPAAACSSEKEAA
jgi:antirestriction protein ArdC